VSGSEERSATRAVCGSLAIAIAIVVIALGFGRMIAGLQTGGHGSATVTMSLVLFGTGGGLLALGISLLIWELSVRYGIRK
jgi:hypothetical protein